MTGRPHLETEYYYAAGQRVAMRRGAVVYFLHSDHLGSTSLATKSNGTELTGSRTWYYPYGEVRAGGSTLPTDYTFTGQRDDAYTGLMDYRARFYDPYFARFISADSIVPNPGNPQDLNRYSYVRNNALRYTDPTGYYSEEEIMQAFGVSTWDAVLAYFQKGGSLEGRWGWLEVLRRAEDEDIVTYKNPDELRWGYFGHLWPTCEAGTWCGAASASFRRNEGGEILVGHMAHSEFALLGDGYGLYKRGALGTYPYYASFATPAHMIHYHYKYDWDRVDKEDIAIDIAGGLLSLAETVPVYTYAAVRTGWMLDIYSINKDLARLDQMIDPGPLEIVATAGELGVDVFGALPVVGVVGDLTGLAVSVGGGIYRTP